ASDCCSLYCVDEVCAEGGACAVTGGECAENYDCCSNICSEEDVCDPSYAPCEPFGESCTSGGNCCSGLCVEISAEEGRCGGHYPCRPGGEVCTEDDDCCNGVCDEGYCALLGECTVVGDPCEGVRECCSNACVESGAGTTTCQYLSGCRPIGEVCEENDDCCSEECEPSDHDLVKRCDNPPGCLDPGEVCFVGASLNCCGGHEFCRPTFAGVYRCYDPEIPEGECIPDGDPCSFSDECCCELCAPDDDGALICCPGGMPCVPNGGACLTDADCCDLNCVDGVCGEPDTSCVPLEGDCTTSEDCCSEYCDPATGKCGVLII
ncbi:MAG: hypothetical protein ABIJ56_03805, partial [Pseudomonadota bacterium]